MRVAIVIVTYNAQPWLDKCLGSCARFASGVPVVVVDNNSTDGTAAGIRAKYPDVNLLPQFENLGFAGGNNVGMHWAMEHGAEAVMLLNQDAELTPGALDRLASRLQAQPELAAVQPLLMLPGGKVNSAGNSFHYLGFGEAAGNGLSVEQAMARVPWLAKQGEPPYLSGAASLWRAAALRQAGLFQAGLFMYHEDMELSLRLRAAGWRLGLEPEARVIHHYEHARSLRQFYYMERNRLIVWNQLFSLRTRMVLLPAFVASELALLFIALIKGWITVKLRSYLYFLKPSAWRSMAANRRELRRIKRLTDRELLAFASPRIEFHTEETGSLTRYVLNPLSVAVWPMLKLFIR